MTTTQINTPSAVAAGRGINTAAVKERFAFNNRYYVVEIGSKTLRISEYQYEVLKKLYELRKEDEYIFTRDGYWSLVEAGGYSFNYISYYYDKLRELHENGLIERVPAEKLGLRSKMKVWVLTPLGEEVRRAIAEERGDEL